MDSYEKISHSKSWSILNWVYKHTRTDKLVCTHTQYGLLKMGVTTRACRKKCTMKTEQKYSELTVFVFYIMNCFLTWKIVNFNWFHNHFLYSLIAKYRNIPNRPFLFFYIVSPFSTVYDRFHPYIYKINT
jgi:hypothetical protein